MDDKIRDQPLAEVFGFPITNQSDRARRYVHNKLCPFNNVVSTCTKNSIEFPLGVCSLFHKGQPVIICPVRFREDWKIISDAASLVFNQGETWTHIGEVRLKDRNNKSAGNIDYVLVSYDDKGQILEFASLEVQAVYISGNLTGVFKAYLENPSPDYSEIVPLKSPNPDFLSSSRKRLIPQIVAKGSILNQWKKKQLVALQSVFYETLPDFPEVPTDRADFYLLIYDLSYDENTLSFTLVLEKIIYTRFEIALEHIAKFEAGPINDFKRFLQRKLKSRLDQ